MVSRRLALLLAGLALGQLGGDCGSGDGGGGQAAVVSIVSPDPRCAALPDPFGFPPGFAFLPGLAGRVLAAVNQPPTLLPLDVSNAPFELPVGTNAHRLRDVDGDGDNEFAVFIDDVFGIASNLALVTVSGFEALHFADASGAPVAVEVSVPATFGAEAFLQLPAPGGSAIRTGIANLACIAPPAGARDSRGALLSDVIDPANWCRPGQPSFRSKFTSGVALAAGHLFVSVSNVGDDDDRENTQYRPAAVTVYDLDLSSLPPKVSPAQAADGEPYILASPGSFNATHVNAYTSASGREFVLVTLTGAIGIRADDPNTSVLESGAVRLTDGAIDVIDAQRMKLVATIPLRGANPAFRGIAIDPSGRVGLVGDLNARQLYAIDLSSLDALPTPPDPQADEVWVLDGSGGRPNALLFDGRNPFRIPPLPGGAPSETCPGWIESVAFSEVGSKAFALELCDGALVTLSVELQPGSPVRPADFRLEDVVALTAPIRADTSGLLRHPASLSIRPGLPGVDFVGPELFFTVGLPEGLLCGLKLATAQP